MTRQKSQKCKYARVLLSIARRWADLSHAHESSDHVGDAFLPLYYFGEYEKYLKTICSAIPGEESIDPDSEYLREMDRRDRARESAQYTRELYNSGDIRTPELYRGL